MRTQPLFDSPSVEAMTAARQALEQALAHAEDDDATAALAAMTALVATTAHLDRASVELARRARSGGATWRDLASATGTTRQSVTRRYRARGLR